MVSIYSPIDNGQEQPTGDDSGSVNQQPAKLQLSELQRYLLEEIAARHQADQKLRDDPDLRIVMTEMMPELGRVMREAATRLAALKGDDSLFSRDYWGDVICWQLDEFLSGGLIERGEAQLTQLSQVDEPHAADWFLINVGSDGTLTPFEIEKSEVSFKP
jgi:hypothetical protein